MSRAAATEDTDSSVIRRFADYATRYSRHARMLWQVAPLWSTISLICTLIGAGCTILGMVATGRLIGALYAVVAHGADASRMWTWFIVFAAATIGGQLQQAVASLSDPRIWAAYRVRVQDLVAEAGLHSRSLAPLDSGMGAELKNIARGSRDWLFRYGMTGTWNLLRTRLVALGSVGVLLPWRWWVPFVVAVAFTLASRTMAIWVDNILDNMWQNPHIGWLQAHYFARLMVDPGPAKEVRLFGIVSWLSERYAELWRKATRVFWRDANRKLRPFFLAAALMIAAIGGSLALLGVDAYHGRVSGSAITTYLLAILALEAFGPQGDAQSGLIRVAGMLRDLGALRVRLGLPALVPAAEPVPSSPSDRESDVDFEDVVFTYPTRSEPTLRNLSLHIPAGQSIAVVGVNGAGKSTLIKLLAGLYEADAGSVRIGGHDVGDPKVRAKVAVIFQDFVHYPLSLRDNVGFGALEHRDDTAVLERAMHDAAGGDVLDRLDHDWDAVLTKEFTGGTDLSGGQWQRVALARALTAVSGGARILVLDEPTAALDVRAEATLFDQFLDVTEGITTILVSHRLATVRRADRIVVLDGSTGHITEDGTHEELLAHGGEYAAMFTLQARRFAEAGTVDEPDES
ncbi:MAG TPA: ABC transporter ATP-binding protein [Mycobacteriales bacterium]|nr:ABC transporter ATP-binding protein [Mycobacteriales bacterium]